MESPSPPVAVATPCWFSLPRALQRHRLRASECEDAFRLERRLQGPVPAVGRHHTRSPAPTRTPRSSERRSGTVFLARVFTAGLQQMTNVLETVELSRLRRTTASLEAQRGQPAVR